MVPHQTKSQIKYFRKRIEIDKTDRGTEPFRQESMQQVAKTSSSTFMAVLFMSGPSHMKYTC